MVLKYLPKYSWCLCIWLVGWPQNICPNMPGISLYKCSALWRAVYGLSATEKKTLELFVKSREFLPGSGFLSRRDMT